MVQINPFGVAPESFKTPYGFESYLRAQASAANRRISEMDMFYANLEEAKRQYDETLGFKIETRGLELDWQKEQWGEELEFREKSLEAESSWKNRQLGIQASKLELEKEKLDLLEAQYESKQESQEDKLEYFKDYMEKYQEQREDYLDWYMRTHLKQRPESGAVPIDTGRVRGFAQDFVSDIRGSSGSGIVGIPEENWRKSFGPWGGGGSSAEPWDPGASGIYQTPEGGYSNLPRPEEDWSDWGTDYEPY